MSASSSGVASITGTITISVQESPTLSTTVATDGSFTLRGLPMGSFTLVFTRNGAPLGTLTFQSVMPNQELSITVDIVSNTIVLLLEQRSGASPTPTPTPKPSSTPTPAPTPAAGCMIAGGTVGRGIELEGVVASGAATNFQLRVNGNRASGPVTIMAGGASFQCTPASGPNAPTPDQCRASVVSGVQVHVSGTLDTCSATTAQVTASKVIVQK